MPRAHVLIRTLLYLHYQLERVSQDTELSPSQYLLLHFLYEEPRLASDFAAANRLQPPSVAGLVKRIEEQGWIERTVDEEDRRARVVRLTDEGRRRFHEYEEFLDDHLSSFLGRDAVEAADEVLTDFYEHWNSRRIERFENWRKNHSARGKRRRRRASEAENETEESHA